MNRDYARYGVTSDFVRAYELRNEVTDVVNKFNSQKSGAKRRGIPFCLTLTQWMKLWDGKIKNMGRKKHNFVMCRTKDEGAYEFGNVRIATPYENHLDRFEKHSHWTKPGCGRMPVVPTADRAEKAYLHTIEEWSKV